MLGDGTILKPWILFKGKGQLPTAETNHYGRGVKFNIEVYANEEVILEWIQEQLLPVIHPKNPNDSPISCSTGLPTGLPTFDSRGLIVLDSTSFYKTPIVRETLQNGRFVLSTTPGCCTALIQVLDVSVNTLFKDFLRETMEDKLDQLVKLEGDNFLTRMDSGG